MRSGFTSDDVAAQTGRRFIVTAFGFFVAGGVLAFAVVCCGITGWLGDVPEPVVTVVGCGGLPASGSVSTSRGRLEPMSTVASRSLDAGVADCPGMAAALDPLAAVSGVRLMVRVCRSRSGAGGIARLTAWSPPGAGGVLEKNIGTNRTAKAIRTAAPSRRVFKFSLQGGKRGAQRRDYTCLRRAP